MMNSWSAPPPLLGVPVEIRALPVQFDWDPGDGTEPLIATGPGGPYGSTAEILHPYPQPGIFTLTLTTHWQGQYRISGTTAWTEIPGQATTQASTEEFEVHEARVRLTS